ncbi:MAG: HAD family phosphatase [Caldilineaceae bacterium]|nr:HAD family phosphatase [Caldilineaceae bacterium]
MIKAIIFDVGGVLIRTETRNARANLEARLGLAPGAAEMLVFNGPLGIQAQSGALTSQALWAAVQAELQLDAAGLAAFRAEFFGGDRLDTELLALVRRLHERYQTAIISNAMDDLLEVVTNQYPLADAFDLIVGSAYQKVMKPAPEIFLWTLAQLGREPHEAVFIDDFAHNIAGARAVGMAAIHYQPGIDLAAELAALGVEVLDAG